MTPPAPLCGFPLSGAFGLEGDRTHGPAKPVSVVRLVFEPVNPTHCWQCDVT